MLVNSSLAKQVNMVSLFFELERQAVKLAPLVFLPDRAVF